MKKISIGLIFGLILAFTINVFAAEVIFKQSTYELYIDGTRISKPLYHSDKGLYIPFEAIEKLGAEVKISGDKIEVAKPETIDVEALKDSCVMIKAYGNGVQSQGSGFVYDGYVVTAYHVIEDMNRIEIYTNDSKTAKKATIVKTHSYYDIAILKADVNKPSVVLGDSETLKAGDNLIAISSPNGKKNTVDYCKLGEISDFYGSKKYTISKSEMIEGSSGGAIFNDKGEVVFIASHDLGEGKTGVIPIKLLKSLFINAK